MGKKIYFCFYEWSGCDESHCVLPNMEICRDCLVFNNLPPPYTHTHTHIHMSAHTHLHTSLFIKSHHSWSGLPELRLRTVTQCGRRCSSVVFHSLEPSAVLTGAGEEKLFLKKMRITSLCEIISGLILQYEIVRAKKKTREKNQYYFSKPLSLLLWLMAILTAQIA